ncbi:MAG TPA: hypothetical protein VGF29_05010 [Hyphomicrobiaceae bacterium]|jgi:hypothetical protein
MLNSQTFTDVDGRQVEIDKRNVRDAYMSTGGNRRAVVILMRDGRTFDLGAGARDLIEAWLGHPIDAYRLKSAGPAVAAPEVAPTLGSDQTPAAATARDLAWLDVRLAFLRDEVIRRVGPAVAARELAALAMIVLQTFKGSTPIRKTMLVDLLAQAHDALVEEAGTGNQLRGSDDYRRALMDEWPAVKALAAFSRGDLQHD